MFPTGWNSSDSADSLTFHLVPLFILYLGLRPNTCNYDTDNSISCTLWLVLIRKWEKSPMHGCRLSGLLLIYSIYLSITFSPPVKPDSTFSPTMVFDIPTCHSRERKILHCMTLNIFFFGCIIPVGFHFDTGFGSAAVLEIIHCCVVSLPFSIVWSRELRAPRTVLHPAHSTEQGGLSQQPAVVWRWGLWLVSTHNAKLSLIRPGI